MRSLGSFFLVVCGLGLTLADGVIHGRLTYRWSGPPVSRGHAAQLLQRVPSMCGEWEAVLSQPLDPYVVNILQCEAHVNRLYVHRQTGDAVQLAVIMGPFGPTSTHTPDLCYTSRNYTIRDDQHVVQIPVAGTERAELWSITVQLEQVQQEIRRVYYGWSDGGPWTAPRQPRVMYGGRPFLYKVQASTVIAPDAAAGAVDPCRTFLEQFLPQLKPFLVSAQP